MGAEDFSQLLAGALDAVAEDADREEGAAAKPAPPKPAVKKSAPAAPPKTPAPVVGVSRPAVPAREIVMPPSPASAPNAKWRAIMQSDEKPDVELQRSRRNAGHCPVCDHPTPRQRRVSAPVLIYCENCSFPYHTFAS